MHIPLIASALMLGLVIADPAICAQVAPPQEAPMPGEPMQPADPIPSDPMPEQPQPADPIPAQPAPMPMPPAPEAPVVIDRSLPSGPPATSPSAAADVAVSGVTTTALMTPTPATKSYPPCTKLLQDNCRNSGEGPKAAKKRR